MSLDDGCELGGSYVFRTLRGQCVVPYHQIVGFYARMNALADCDGPVYPSDTSIYPTD